MNILSSLLNNYGWFSLLIGILLFYFVFKMVRKVLVTIMAFVFTLIGFLRLWTMLH
ncbi:hypothetical protein [Rummeliibacillus stabekisii]|uniref:hypothetical protein n=1 Tax=Rummeliibacillus stabekisii TaxID=241244 RepID=UPI0037245CD7